MTCVGRKHGPTADLIVEHARQFLGEARAAVREQDIAALPTIMWKGRMLYTVRCQGTSGKGAHDVNVPLGLVWHLVSLRSFYCPYHAGDVWRPPGAAGQE